MQMVAEGEDVFQGNVPALGRASGFYVSQVLQVTTSSDIWTLTCKLYWHRMCKILSPTTNRFQ
jgi:hypothetical protein